MEDDTIVAIATPPGRGALGVVRISGAQSTSLVAGLAPEVRTWRDRRATLAILRDAQGQVLDETVATVFVGPHSYSGEDMVEISCHGSSVVLDRLVEAILAQGGRAARPGEFTLRAFLNGRLDLTQAEAVLDLVNAKTDAGRGLALRQMEKALSGPVGEIRSELLDILAHITALVDFSEEDISPIIGEAMMAKLTEIHHQLADLQSGARQGEVLQHGVSLAIVGSPNAGKSSILNGLLGRERAIVTPIAGTTRDTLEEEIDLGGILFRVIDTAGIRESTDTIEMMGVSRSREAIAAADVVVVVIDGSRELTSDDLEVLDAARVEACPQSIIVALNKSDLPSVVQADDVVALAPDALVLTTCALEQSGLESLRERLHTVVLQGPVPDGFVISNKRHLHALQNASHAVKRAISAHTEGVPLDLVGLDVRDAIESLGEILGIGISEDLLDRVFSNFCIGK